MNNNSLIRINSVESILMDWSFVSYYKTLNPSLVIVRTMPFNNENNEKNICTDDFRVFFNIEDSQHVLIYSIMIPNNDEDYSSRIQTVKNIIKEQWDQNKNCDILIK